MKVNLVNNTTLCCILGFVSLVIGLILGFQFIPISILFFFSGYGQSRRYIEISADNFVLCLSRLYVIQIPKRKISDIQILEKKILIFVNIAKDKPKKYTILMRDIKSEDMEKVISSLQKLKEELLVSAVGDVENNK